MGQTAFVTPQRMTIRISRRYNKTVNKYAGTLLHELVHAWINMLELRGFNPDPKKEEEFILRAEQLVIREFTKKFC